MAPSARPFTSIKRSRPVPGIRDSMGHPLGCPDCTKPTLDPTPEVVPRVADTIDPTPEVVPNFATVDTTGDEGPDPGLVKYLRTL